MAGVRIDDAHAQADALGRPGEVPEERERLLVEVALGHPQRVVAQAFGEPAVGGELRPVLDAVVEHEAEPRHVHLPRSFGSFPQPHRAVNAPPGSSPVG